MPYKVTATKQQARGLRLPSHIGITAEGRILVSEFGGGAIRDVTDGGDYSSQSLGLLVSGLKNPSGILPTKDGSILIADSGAGEVLEYGDDKAGVLSAKRSSGGFSNPYGVVIHEDKVFVTFSNKRMVGLTEVTFGKASPSAEESFVHGFPVVITSEPTPELMGCGGSWPTTGFRGKILLGHYALGAVFDVTKGGTFDDLRESRFAWGLNGPLGMTVDPIDNDLYVVEKASGVIKRIPDGGGYSRFAEPLLAGFQEPSCIRFMPSGEAAYVCDRAWGAVYKLELKHIE